MKVLPLVAFLLGFCSGGAEVATAQNLDPSPHVPGPSTKLVAPLEGSDDLEVIVSDVFLPPGASLPRHFHPGQDFVYVIEGEVLHEEAGKEDRVYRAGEAFFVQRDVVHSERTLDQPVRAVVFHVHPVGEPVRVPVE